MKLLTTGSEGIGHEVVTPLCACHCDGVAPAFPAASQSAFNDALNIECRTPIEVRAGAGW
jgi:hypothetical protein